MKGFKYQLNRLVITHNPDIMEIKVNSNRSQKLIQTLKIPKYVEVP